MSLTQAREELASQKATLRQKVADRDTTISAFSKSSVSQGQKMVSSKAEINALTAKLRRLPLKHFQTMKHWHCMQDLRNGVACEDNHQILYHI